MCCGVFFTYFEESDFVEKKRAGMGQREISMNFPLKDGNYFTDRICMSMIRKGEKIGASLFSSCFLDKSPITTS